MDVYSYEDSHENDCHDSVAHKIDDNGECKVEQYHNYHCQ